MYVILFLNIFIFKNISACQRNMESLYLSFKFQENEIFTFFMLPFFLKLICRYHHYVYDCIACYSSYFGGYNLLKSTCNRYYNIMLYMV